MKRIDEKGNFRNPVTLSEADVSISWQLVGDGQLQQEFTPIQVFKLILMMIMMRMGVLENDKAAKQKAFFFFRHLTRQREC